MTSRSLTLGQGPGADVTEEIARAFGIPSAVFGEPEPERWRPCLGCGATWHHLSRHEPTCRFARGHMDPLTVRAAHVIAPPPPSLRVRIGRTTLPWEAQ